MTLGTSLPSLGLRGHRSPVSVSAVPAQWALISLGASSVTGIETPPCSPAGAGYPDLPRRMGEAETDSNSLPKLGICSAHFPPRKNKVHLPPCSNWPSHSQGPHALTALSWVGGRTPQGWARKESQGLAEQPLAPNPLTPSEEQGQSPCPRLRADRSLTWQQGPACLLPRVSGGA